MTITFTEILAAREIGKKAEAIAKLSPGIISIINDNPRRKKDKRLMVPISQVELDAAHSFAKELGVSTSDLVRLLLKTTINAQGLT